MYIENKNKENINFYLMTNMFFVLFVTGEH